MREILFRGKRIDSGEWVVGIPWIFAPPVNKAVIVYAMGLVGEDDDTSRYCECHEVDPSTIGQYTGLTDKSDKKIFEGDILSIAQKSNGLGDYFYPSIKYPANVIVKWDKCSWMWEVIAKQKYYLTFPDAWCHYECEIIGNIYDNPELLEVNHNL